MIKFSVKKISGKKYLYASESIYINKGKILSKNKSLGPIASLTDNAQKVQGFENEIAQSEMRERANYWKPKVKHIKAFQYVTFEYLEELRVKLYRGKQHLGLMGRRAMETAFLINFIYNSNKIEGSRLPQKRVTEIVRKGITGKNNEVTNTMKAIEFFDSTAWPLTLAKIKKGQNILLAHEEGKSGFRKEPFIVGNAQVLEHTEIQKNLNELFDWYEAHEYTMYPPELAFLFHYRFERIHPFPDGNGRIGRILMNFIFKRHRYHPIIVWNSRRSAYFSSFEKAMEGNMVQYLQFMIDQYRKTYTIYFKRLEPAISFDIQLRQFLMPSE